MHLKDHGIRTERAYVDWIRRCILFHHRCHPREREVAYLKQKAAKLGFDLLPHNPTVAVAQAVAMV